MNEFLKKGFLLGLGVATVGKEKVERKLKELVEANELTREEAREVMREFVEKGEMTKDEWDAKQSKKNQELAKELDIATQSDIELLEERISQLEEKIAESD